MKLLVRSGLRRRAAALVGLAAVIALGIGTTMASLSIAWRTDHAYADYLHDAEVGDVVVNPSLTTDRLDDAIASTPGVLDVVSDGLFIVTPDEGAPRARREVEGEAIQFRASTDGRYRDRDRPVVHRGRLISGKGEAFLTLDAAARLGLDVGDDMPVAFWQASPNEDEADTSEVVDPLGTTTVRVVGVGILSDEVLPDELYPRQRVLLSPDVTAPFDCTIPHPPNDDALTIEDLAQVFFPPGCSRDPMFFSLKVAGSDRGVPAVLAALTERLDDESSRLPKVMRDLGFGFQVIPTVTADERARVERSLDPGVTALRLFGVVAALSTLAVVGLGAVRSCRRIEPQTRVWFQMGMTRPQRMMAAGLPLAVAGVVGLAGAVAVAWVASAIGPVGSAQALVPHASYGVPVAVAAATGAVAVVVLAAEFAVASLLSTRGREAPAAARPSRISELTGRLGNVPLALGVRAALPGPTARGTGAGALLAGAVTVVAAVIGCVVFSSNLSGLVGTPARFGWPFDAAAIVNFGYGSAQPDAIAKSLDRPEVEEWGLAALPGEVSVNDEALPAVAGLRGFDDFQLPIVAGEYPRAGNEIALGVRSARRLGVTVGDKVDVATPFGDRPAQVAGLVVLPSVGPFSADRAGLGTGALLSTPLFHELLAEAERDRDLPEGELAASVGTFIAINVRDGVDPGRLMRQLGGELPTWDASELAGFPYGEPVRPPEVADVAAMRSAPAILAAMLAATMSVALAVAIALGTRARRRELAVLRALGCTARQLRATVRWHSLSVVAVGLALGVLLGLSLGSTTWRSFAAGLGVATSVGLPLRWILLAMVAVVVDALLAAAIPARLAPLRASATHLRQE